jgi:hypothetical protein
MKLKIGVGVLFGIALVGYVAIAAEQKSTRPSKEDRGATKVESKQDRLEQEMATLPEGVEVQLTERAYPEVYRSMREAAGLSPSDPARPARPSVGSVETTGGTLAILERGDGAVRVMAVAMNHENPDLESADRGIAFTAIITADGIEVLSVDKELLTRFVGKNEQRSVSNEADGGVAGDMNCTSVGVTTCCLFATETKYCQCCSSFNAMPVCLCVAL